MRPTSSVLSIMDQKVLAVLISILTFTSGLPSVQQVLRSTYDETSPNEQDLQPLSNIRRVEADLCPLCVQFTGEAINQLLNIILNGGVVGSCAKVCGALQQKTGSAILGAACNILCDVVGVEEFVKLIEKADLDPIYFCEELKACPVFDSGDAIITKIAIMPVTGPQGVRQVMFNYTSSNGTGTGEIAVSVKTVDGIPVGTRILQEPLKAGNYSKNLKIDAEPDPNCDPTQGPCEMWQPGNYTLAIEICNGECGSKHPHSQVYDKKEAVFVIGPN